LTFQPLEAVGFAAEAAMQTMHTIGEFAKLTQVSEKTLRYYDDLGLLRPRRAPGSGRYRSYGADELERLNRILALKDLGLSLAELRTALGAGMTGDDLLAIAGAKQAALAEAAASAAARARRAGGWLRLVDRGDATLMFSIAVRATGACRILALRDTLATHEECERLFDEIAHARSGRPGLRGAIWHACAPGRIDCEAFEIADAPAKGRSRVRARALPATRSAVLAYRGERDYLRAYAALRAWVQASGSRVVGAKSELFLTAADTAEESLTEIRIPVAA
jgi:DNA-binding transcriptional MerR regulator